MNLKNKSWKIPIIITVTSILVLVIYLWIFSDFFDKDGKPVREDVVIEFSDPDLVKYGIGEMTLFDDRNYIYKIPGWAFSKIDIDEPTDLYNTEIVLYRNNQNFVFDVIPRDRVDIKEAFKAYKVGNAGFDVIINRKAIPRGNYCIGILLTHKKNQSTYLFNTNRVIVNKLSGLTLLEEDVLFCDELLN